LTDDVLWTGKSVVCKCGHEIWKHAPSTDLRSLAKYKRTIESSCQ